MHDKLYGTHWYQTASGRSFHHESPNWVRSGLALCGAKLKNPVLAITSPVEGQTRLCKRCLAKLPERAP